jgi:hypothetical protein
VLGIVTGEGKCSQVTKFACILKAGDMVKRWRCSGAKVSIEERIHDSEKIIVT